MGAHNGQVAGKDVVVEADSYLNGLWGHGCECTLSHQAVREGIPAFQIEVPFSVRDAMMKEAEARGGQKNEGNHPGERWAGVELKEETTQAADPSANEPTRIPIADMTLASSDDADTIDRLAVAVCNLYTHVVAQIEASRGPINDYACTRKALTKGKGGSGFANAGSPTKSKSKEKQKTKRGPKPTTKAGLLTKLEAEVKLVKKVDVSAKTDAETMAETDDKPDVEVDAKAGAAVGVEFEAKARIEVEVEVEVNHEAETRTEPSSSTDALGPSESSTDALIMSSRKGERHCPPTSTTSKVSADGSSPIADGNAMAMSRNVTSSAFPDAQSVEEMRRQIRAMLKDIRLLDARDEDNQI